MIEKLISELIPCALALLAFLKLVFPKVAERVFDHALNRQMTEFKATLDASLEAYKDELARATSARSLIFDREMRFFEITDNLLAELIPLIQDMRDAILSSGFGEQEKNYFLRYLEIIPELKKTLLVYEPYIDQGLKNALTELLICIQADSEKWIDSLDHLVANEVGDDDITWAEETCDSVLHEIAGYRTFQIAYLRSVSG